MEITRETDYAVRCVLHLASAPERVAVLGEIAAERGVPRTFLAKILQRLSKAGLVKSRRGVRGGFQLSRDARTISLLHVVEAVQGPVRLNRCVSSEGGCSFRGDCPAHPVWEEASTGLARLLARYDFEKLSRREREGREEGSIGQTRNGPARRRAPQREEKHV